MGHEAGAPPALHDARVQARQRFFIVHDRSPSTYPQPSTQFPPAHTLGGTARQNGCGWVAQLVTMPDLKAPDVSNNPGPRAFPDWHRISTYPDSAIHLFGGWHSATTS